uniref:IS481 family transposase n=1 Tax=Oceanithermus sp. TaxID=2268145 RepID=UPI0025EA43FA
MNRHENVRRTLEVGRVLVPCAAHEGLPVREAAKVQGVSARTAYKWLRRYREEGEAGLYDRSSRPRRSPRRIPDQLRAQVTHLRQQRWPYHAIAEWLGISKSTVGRTLKAQGLNRLSALEPKPPPRRFEAGAPGVLLHLDTKKLARFKRPGHRVTQNRKDRNRSPGWSYVFTAVDDHSRLAYVEVKANERKESAVAFLLSALRHYRRLGIRPKTTPPYAPRTNGKAERFIRTLLNEWAYAHAYACSEERNAHLPEWLHLYNGHWPHTSLGHQAPISRLGLRVN